MSWLGTGLLQEISWQLAELSSWNKVRGVTEDEKLDLGMS